MYIYNRMATELGMSSLKILKHGAVTDAIHDFSHQMAFNKNNKHDDKKPGLYELKSGLPKFGGVNIPTGDNIKGGVDKWKDENEFLKYVIGTGADVFDNLSEGFNDGQPYMYQFVENIKEGFRVENDYKYTKDLHIKSGAEDNISYNVKILNYIPKKGSAPRFDAKIFMDNISIKDYIDFFESNTLNILTDAYCISIIDLLRRAVQTKDVTLTLQKIINREVFNDPATKKYKTTSEKKPSLNEDFLWDDEKNTIMYAGTTG